MRPFLGIAAGVVSALALVLQACGPAPAATPAGAQSGAPAQAAQAAAPAGSALQQLIAKAQQEGSLRAQLLSTAAPESDKIKAAFLKKFGLNINMEIGWGNESTEFQKAEAAMKSGAAPDFDVMFGEDGNNLNFINQGLATKIDNWEELVAAVHTTVQEGKVKPEQVSPAPFTGYSLMQGNRVKVMLFNPRLVTADQIPDTYEDFANPRFQGKYTVPPWSSTWEMGLLVYPRDHWLQVVDAAGKNAAGVLHFEGSLDRILSGNLPFAQSNSHYYYEVKSRDASAPLDLKFFKDMSFMNRVFYMVPAKSRHPAAGTLFALFMTSDEGRTLERPAHFSENIEFGQLDVDDKDRQGIAQSGGKVLSWFSTPEAQQQLQWVTTPEGKQYSEAISRALTQRK